MIKCAIFILFSPLGDPLGRKVSILSLGASSFGSVFRETDDEESIQVVHTALKSGMLRRWEMAEPVRCTHIAEIVKTGINVIDTAAWYGFGKSERVLGKALADVPRQAYYINTKCGRYEK